MCERAVSQFLRLNVETAWGRIVRKIDHILDMPSRNRKNIWAHTDYGRESSKPIQQVADKSFGGDTLKALERDFQSAFDLAQRIRTENFETDEERKDYLATGTSGVRYG
ncbi:hypothetical protein SCP_0213550 [Sparassis crispa]|uniref:Uncharacterized protein n=1 Tax=Sparassis crispa TaxID=139825 RepID=A0A401GDB1_9APHY|nr:hypothetical protein SCP_0213550 [Sparassis crispa]GBE80152.1 hypothetical protein SCP_0213550 [Sparassis crispa]